VTITSEQESTQKLIDDAKDRLAKATKRASEAHAVLFRRDVRDFFDDDVVKAIGSGERDPRALRKVGGYTSLSDSDIEEVVARIDSEFNKARRELESLISHDESANDYPEWDEYKLSHSDLPPGDWDAAWEIVYESLVRPPQPRRAHSVLGGGFAYEAYMPGIIDRPTPEYVKLNAERRDAMHANIQRTQQQVEDIQGEVTRLERTRGAVVRPKGLGRGLVVLAYFTLVGVIVPLWLMSRAPQHLTARLGEVVFWLFFTGLAALLGYMTVLALRLSGWRMGHSSHSTGRS
jgi:hypothetical protein